MAGVQNALPELGGSDQWGDQGQPGWRTLGALFLEQPRYAANTREAYRRALDRWFTWCETVRADPFRISPVEVNAYARFLEDTGFAARSRQQFIGAVSAYYQWCARMGAVSGNPVAKGTAPRVDPLDSPTVELPRTHIADFLAVLDRRTHYRHGWRDRAAGYVLVGMALRSSQICGLRLEDFIPVGDGRWRMRVRLKGGGHAQLPVPERTAQAILDYLPHRREPRDVMRGGPLFVNETGVALQRRWLPPLVRQTAVEVGGLRDVAPLLRAHSVRHTMATSLLTDGVPIQDVARVMQHKWVSTTQVYDRRAQMDLCVADRIFGIAAEQIERRRARAIATLAETDKDAS